MDRTVQEIEKNPGRDNEPRQRLFSGYDDAPVVVLLGDPGAGKTHTFRESASRCGGRYTTARSFLVTPADRLDGVLFIDGLDERRGGRSDLNTVDALVTKLFAVAPTKVRISCRVADWLGDTDLAGLQPFFEGLGEPVVLKLGRLSTAEQTVVLTQQGFTAAEATAFLAEATDRSLGDFLDNPQNLLMLCRAVENGVWPTTRKELFELATQLMLREFDPAHARTGSGVYSADELRSAAGAAFATRLVSDVEAIRLTDHEEADGVPSYRSLRMIEPAKMSAVLGRRVFVGGPVPESVDYAHRTTAEYLGAAWLADAVRGGLPIGRVLALIGIDDHPAPELRGLHAWLAVHLPEHSARLIDGDPYGVLTYGDAASLSRSACAHLGRALAQLSQTDPWFRSKARETHAIAGLARADMADEFRQILRTVDAGFGVRSLVLEAMSLGSPMPDLIGDLADVMVSDSPFAERHYAFRALLHNGSSGRVAAVAVFPSLGTAINGLRLRTDVIRKMYGEPFGPADVGALVTDMMRLSTGETASGVLYSLARHLPIEDIPAVLDALLHGDERPRGRRRNQWEVGRFLSQLLVRIWVENADIDPRRALGWLQVRHSFSSGYSMSDSQGLRAALTDRSDVLDQITAHFLAALPCDDDRWGAVAHFRDATLYTVTSSALLTHVLALMADEVRDSEKEHFLYELAVQVSWNLEGAPAIDAAEALFQMAEERPELLVRRDRMLLNTLHEGYLDRPQLDDIEGSAKSLRADFEQHLDAIRSGMHLGGLTWAAQAYFGNFYDSDGSVGPRERLVGLIGKENAEVAIAGFIAVLSRNDLPSLTAVVDLVAQQQRYDWWGAVAAGFVERWSEGSNLDGIRDDVIQGMVVYDLANPAFEKTDNSHHLVTPEWKTVLLQRRPELVRDAYLALVRAKLRRGDLIIDGLRELMNETQLEPYRGEIAIGLLREFPNAAVGSIKDLIGGVFGAPDRHGEFVDLAGHVLGGERPLEVEQHDIWLAAAYMLSPTHYELMVREVASVRRGIVFDLRDRAGFRSADGEDAGRLMLPELEFLAGLSGRLFPLAPHPASGWYGDTNDWDASDYCHKLINSISALPSQDASEALRRLETDLGMASYRAHLRHALANQEQLRRDAEYDRPDWRRTVEALRGGQPATVADLHALVLDQLRDLAVRITRENTDLFKQFWNVDQYARLTKPRPEEACRDTLVTLLRPAVTPKHVSVEPEGHMIGDRRADISVAMSGRKILCELKRDYHADLWTAADQQLERFYAHDPEAKGFGIYGVFWFGPRRPTTICAHPDELNRPESPAELERMLRDRLPTDRRARLAVIVLDVSGPA